MTFKRALAIGGLSILAITLTILGLNTNAFKHKKAEETRADTREVLFNKNFNTEVTITNTVEEQDYTTTFNVHGTYTYYKINIEDVISYQILFRFNYRCYFHQLDYTLETTTTSASDERWYFSEELKTLSLYMTYVWNQGTNEGMRIDMNYYYNDNTDRAVIHNVRWTETPQYNLNNYVQLGHINQTIISKVNVENEITDYEDGYQQGYQDGFSDAEEQIIPSNTPNQNYTLTNIDYNNEEDKIYFSANGQFQTQVPILTNLNKNFSIQGQTKINVTQKEYLNTQQVTVNGYQLQVSVFINEITNLTDNTSLTSQSDQNGTKGIIYTPTIPESVKIKLERIQYNLVQFNVTVANQNYLFVNSYFYTPLTPNIITRETARPTTETILTDYRFSQAITSLQNIINTEKEESYNTGLNEGNGGTEIVPLQDIMLNILTMPFTFISQAFDVTLWEGTNYAFNIGSFIKAMIAISAILFIIKVFTSGFSVMGNFTGNINSKITSKQNKSSKPKTETKKE